MARKRRGKGEGSITQLPDGRWQARLTYWEGGRRRRKAFYGKTRAEARAKLMAALADLQRGLPVPPERQSVGEFLERWLKDVVAPSVRPRTFASYSQLVRRHLLPTLGRVRLVRLTAQDIQACLNQKRQEGLSARTVQYLHAILRRALGQAEKWGLVARNVARLVDAPKVVRPEVKPLAPEDVRRLLDAARGDSLEALYVVAIAVGLRQGELLGLRWQDVDLERGLLSVRVQLQRINGKLQLTEPKSSRSKRTVQLPAVALKALREHRARQLEERLRAGLIWDGSMDLVFTTTRGTPLDARNVVRHFHGLLARAGLPRMPFHNLRHTAAILLLAQGLDIRVVQQVLGHSQIALTANLYTQVMPVLLEDAAKRMDAILRG